MDRLSGIKIKVVGIRITKLVIIVITPKINNHSIGAIA